jgi:ubiquinone/menaquinone biosynthesis C-methylase UbiE
MTNSTHAMYPQATASELEAEKLVAERINFARSQVAQRLGNLYETSILPAFNASYGRAPGNLLEVREAFRNELLYAHLGEFSENTQDWLWRTELAIVQRQLNQLIEISNSLPASGGSLNLDRSLVIPKHQTQVDIHRMPGGYTRDTGAGDIISGALYDRGVSIYAGGGFGPLNDVVGRTAIQAFGKLQPLMVPASILDLGCAVGHSTLPYVDAFPGSEIHAIDIAAPMLRYAHARAESLSKPVHFSQRDASATGFGDSSFDLITSHILLHETPVRVIKKIFQECKRLLKPGGIMLHIDVRPYRAVGDVAAPSPFTAFLLDWDHVHNGEPYWHSMRMANLADMAEKAGFARENIKESVVPTWRKPDSENTANAGITGVGQWYVLTARKQ